MTAESNKDYLYAADGFSMFVKRRSSITPLY